MFTRIHTDKKGKTEMVWKKKKLFGMLNNYLHEEIEKKSY